MKIRVSRQAWSMAAGLIPLWCSRGSPTDGWLFSVILASLGLAAVNFLPVQTLDGGRMPDCFLGEKSAACIRSPIRCTLSLFITHFLSSFTSLLTVTVIGAAWIFSAYALLRSGRYLSLITFYFCFFAARSIKRAVEKQSFP